MISEPQLNILQGKPGGGRKGRGVLRQVSQDSCGSKGPLLAFQVPGLFFVGGLTPIAFNIKIPSYSMYCFK